ncbi:MAG TPA: YtxH domain-containing protein [Candidatus Chromulinivoraceae bacterium]|nr:YtxH domain-containing protein [Candidatus Chromulinivoraceae bacterium]
MTKGKFALGAIIGAAAGIVAGLLTAPKSGKETRADIKDKATELKESAARKSAEAKDYSDEMVTDLKEKAGDLKDRGERALEGAKKGFSEKDK